VNVIASLPFGDTRRFGPGLEGVLLQLRSAAFAAKSDTAYLAERTDDGVKLLCSFNLPAAFGFEWNSSMSLKHLLRQKVFISDVSRVLIKKQLSNNPEEKWAFIANVPVRSCISSALLTLTCASTTPKLDFSSSDLDTLSAISECLGHYLMSLNDLQGFTADSNSRILDDYGVVTQSKIKVGQVADINSFDKLSFGGDIAHQFLVQTLVKGPKIRTFKGVSCTIINTWRTPIKEWQLRALKICKYNPSQEMIKSIAYEFANRLEELGVLGMLDCVTNVPCGHSGPACLSWKIANAIADVLGIPHELIFEDLPVSGSSHPRQNIGRPSMKIIPHKNARFLLVDDVVTSGSHIVEAVSLIRQLGSLAYPVVWIGG